MKKALFIYNPLSGDRIIQQRLDHIIQRFQEKNILLQPYRIFGNSSDLIPNAIKEANFTYVIISGGDGTINSIINILMKNKVNLPIGIIPSGTSNDLARCLDIPSSINECLDIILTGNTSEIDIGLINDDRYFLTSCSGGLFSNISFSTHSELKKNFGPFAYYLKALSEVANIKSFPIKITTNTDVIQQDIILFLILNGKNAAGLANILKEADLSDGIMDIVLVKNCMPIDLAALFFKVLAKEIIDDRNITVIRTKSCTIETASDIILSVDGEKGPSLPISVKFINKGLKIFTPNNE